MDARWRQIESLFNAAREHAPESRAAFLQQNCTDEVLRREVESLLAKDAISGAPLDGRAWDDASGLLDSSPDMILSAGAMVGPYRVAEELGAGGMGRVFRADDVRLGRSVAIKTSRNRFTERFEREARAIASLNHPNICTLYDVGANYLVMELVEGPTLADRIKKGPIPLEQALELARQIADALEAAHDAGIVHRDLKPGNIKIRPDGTVKVLDFGLAKMNSRPLAAADGSPSVDIPASDAGVILGTAAYMAPEQAKGERVDKRADIWSFGAVFYEMITGKRLFSGNSLTEILASVLKEEPDLSQTPTTVHRLLRNCLEKDPRKRLRDIGDAVRLLPEETQDSSSLRARRFPGLVFAVASLAALTIATALLFYFREKPASASKSISFQIIPQGISRYAAMALSPNGGKLAFSGIGIDGVTRLWVRELDSLTARSIPEAEGIVGDPIWSPDGRYLVFAAGGRLKKIEASGGTPLTLCDWPGEGGLLTGDWGDNNVILFSRPAGGIQKVSASGGACSDLTTSGRYPNWILDGRHFVYFQDTGKRGAYVGGLDATPSTQPTEPILLHPSRTGFVPSATPLRGYLVYAQTGGSNALAGTLMAQPFDPQRMKISGEPMFVRVASEGGFGNAAPSMMFAFSADGTIAYCTNGTGRYQNIWYDRTGKVVGTAGDAGDIGDVALSPDGSQAAFHNREGTDDVWLFEFSRRISTRLTTSANRDHQPVWSPDGRRIIWGISLEMKQSLYVKASNGTGEEHLVTSGDPDSYNVPNDWSPDGRFLLYAVGALPSGRADRSSGIGMRLWALPLQADGTAAGPPQIYIENTSGVGHARFSPNGRFVAYTVGSGDTQNVYVSPFPAPQDREERWVVSNGGGFQPLWRHDGKELYYLSLDGKVMAVDVNTTSESFQSAAPKSLFTARIAGGPPAAPTHRWDVSPDGQRFLIVTVLDITQSPAVNIMTNWESALKR